MLPKRIRIDGHLGAELPPALQVGLELITEVEHFAPICQRVVFLPLLASSCGECPMVLCGEVEDDDEMILCQPVEGRGQAPMVWHRVAPGLRRFEQTLLFDVIATGAGCYQQ